MSYKLIRVLTCDAPDCDSPVYPVQGEDDQAIKDGWFERREPNKPPQHLCPKCRGRILELPPLA